MNLYCSIIVSYIQSAEYNTQCDINIHKCYIYMCRQTLTLDEILSSHVAETYQSSTG